jgi:pimeloyl-ACP methyl ester carboxylesterase
MNPNDSRPSRRGEDTPRPEGGPAFTRRRFVAGLGVAGATLAAGVAPAVSFASGKEATGSKGRPGQGRPPRPPGLPAGFGKTFRSRFIKANGIRQHAVIGGDGPPLLLVHGWPETWFAWRLVMPQLARDFEVIAVDQRGIGETDKPAAGYDTATLATDLVALMDALGHDRFAYVGHDTGFFIGYALASDHPDRVERAALLEVPGPPGAVDPPPPLWPPERINNKLWHIPVNRLHGVNEALITGREDIYFGYEFEIQAGKKLPVEVVDYYVRLVSTPETLRGSLAFFQAWEAMLAQNMERRTRKLPMPILAIGGAASWGPAVGATTMPLGTNVQSMVIPGAGHWLAEEAPAELLAALGPFLAPYRDAAQTPPLRPVAA